MSTREWSRGEEVANSLSHGCGFVAAIIGVPFLIQSAMHHDGGRALIGMSIFATTTILLYLSSAVHHWLRPGDAKNFFEALDHAAIFLMIAGTYTPFATGVLWGPWGWALLAIIWPLAIFGIRLKTLHGPGPQRWTTWLYVAMGWLMVIAFPPLAVRIHWSGLMLLVAGGVAYTGGLVFWFARRFPYHHLAWHLCVLIGTAFHYAAIFKYAY
ncbi:MAG: hemolysin III family protein [Chthoniobacter sp.]|nr:hemolysin III family protein [Chthoniobacter sp.]